MKIFIKQLTEFNVSSINCAYVSFPDHTNENEEENCCLILSQAYILLEDLQSVVFVQTPRQVLYLSENNSGCG